MQALVLLVVLLLVAGTAMNWSYVDAYFTHNVGAPAMTVERLPVRGDEQPFTRFAVAGDVGTGGAAERRTATIMDEVERETPFDALLLLGDNVYEDGNAGDVDERVYQPFAEVLDDGTELIAVLGNHDVLDDNGSAQVRALGMPGPWYSVLVGDVMIIALDSNRSGDPDQRAWLEATLAEQRPTWTVVIMHHPAYSAGWHGGDEGVQDIFVPLFTEFAVDLVLSGHDHDYQRSRQIDGVTYVVTGAAAKLRRTGREDFTEVSWSTYSFVDLVAYPDRLVGQAIDQDGRAIDYFELLK